MAGARRSVAPFPIAIVVLFALTTGTGPATARSASVPATRAGGLRVLAFADGDTTAHQIAASSRHTATLGIDGVNVSTNGASVSAPDRTSLATLRIAKRRHKPAVLLFGNYSDRLGDFDPAAVHALVSSAAHIAAVTKSLARIVRREGWSGINVDLEAIRSADTAGVVRFVTRLRSALPRRRTVSMDVSAFPTAREYRENGYDLTRLRRVLDRVVLMAYDQHGPTWSGPGPVGGLAWQRASLRAVLHYVPARRVDLGVAGYGYSWPRRGAGRQYSDAHARAIVAHDGSHSRWNAKQGEWTATLRNGTVLWWSDARSWRLRVALARGRSLHGLALWSLSLSDPLTTS